MKRILSILLTLALVICLFPAALAEDIRIVDIEEDDGPITVVDPEAISDDTPVGRTFQTAKEIEFGREYSTAWGHDSYRQLYYIKFTVPERGKIDFYFTKPMDSDYKYVYLSLTLYDEGGQEELWKAYTLEMAKTASDRYAFALGLDAGVYYMTIEYPYILSTGEIAETFFRFDYVNTLYYEVEPRQTRATAIEVKHGIMYGADIGAGDMGDYFRFKLEEGKQYRLYISNWPELERNGTSATIYSPSRTANMPMTYSDERGNYFLLSALYSDYYCVGVSCYADIPIHYTFGVFEDGKEYATPISTKLSFFGSTKGVAVSWEAVPDASSYELQRKDSGSWEKLATLSGTSYTDASAQMGTTYKYRIRAKLSGSWSDYCDPAEYFFNPFTDVSGTKTIEYVAWAFNNGIVNGTSTTTFAPDAPCSRIQFVMMLWKMHGSPVVGGTNPFGDISGTKTTNAILWALDAGVINSGKNFDPNGNISRVQIVMILWKLAGSPIVGGTNPFADVSGTKTTKAVLWAYQNGITKGTSATTFAPDKDCTRVQLVIFLYKYNNIYHVI